VSNSLNFEYLTICDGVHLLVGLVQTEVKWYYWRIEDKK